MKKLISIAFIIFLTSITLHAQCDITGTLSVCVGSTTQLSGTGIPGATPWTSASPGIASVDNNGLVTGLAVGTSEITYTSTICSSTAIVTVTAPSVIPTFNQIGPLCQNSTAADLPLVSTNSTPISGTWSPATISTASAGTTSYTFTPTAGQCATTTSMDITIDPQITPSFNPVDAICSGGSLLPLPTTSLNGISGTWSPALNNSATTTYTFTPTAGLCATSTTLIITVNPIVTPAFNPVDDICSGGSLLPLPTTSLNGISGTWSPALNNSATTTYTFTPTAGLCATSTTLTITVNPIVTPAFNPVAAICSGGSLLPLPTTSLNGISGTWSPALNNTATTTYTFTPTAGLCATSTTLTITVNPNITPAFNPVAAICSGGSLLPLPTTSLNGISGTWSPALNNSATTTYTFTPTAGLCATSTTLTITVNPIVTPAFNPVAAICSGGSLLPLPTTSLNGISGTWSPALNNTATTTYTFTPTAGLCATSTTLTITVNPIVTPAFNPVAAICSGGSLLPLPTTSLNGISGTWSPALNNTATTTYTFTPTAGLCATSTTLTITVNPVITPTFNPVAAICSGGSLLPLPTTSLNGISGTWSPALNNTATTTYTFTPTAGLCATSTTLTITVNPNITPAFNPVAAICSGGSLSPLPTTSLNGISGTWSPALNNTATTTYTFTPTAGLCATSTNLTITVYTTPTAPSVGTITQPTCFVATGSVALSGLPSSGTWILTRTPGGTTYPGSGTNVTVTGLPVNASYTFTVTNASGCISPASVSVGINAAPPIPTAPSIGSITQPTCSVATGSVALSGLPSSGSWILTRTPGGTTYPGSGTNVIVTGLPANASYTFTVTNASGCISPASVSFGINPAPAIPTAPSIGTITQPTCSVATGSVALSGLPSSGTWTLTRTPGGTTYPGTGTNVTVTGLPANASYTFTVTNDDGCISAASGSVGINAALATPTAPSVGTITQPTCFVATGSVALSGLPSSGTWTLTRTPGGTTTTGTGTSTTVTGIPSGTFTYTVTNSSGCISTSSGSITINTNPSTPTPPVVGIITQPTCSVATGSVALSGLPSTGTWTLTRTPGGTIYSGSGTSYVVSGLAAGTYTFTVTNATGCTSAASVNVVVNAQPSTPSAPSAGTITQPTCGTATGSVILTGLPATGTWTLTMTPGGTTYSGSGTSYTVTGLPANTSYTFTVTNAAGCISGSSTSFNINAQPVTPSAPVAGTVTHPTCTVATGSVALNGLPSTGTWTLTRTPGGTTYPGSGTSYVVTGLAAGTYTFTVSNASGCTSAASANVIINAQPATPSAPVVGTITHPTCTIATGDVLLTGLPATGTWTLTRTPGGITTSGTGTSYTISGLTSGTYSYTVTNASGCISTSSANVIINIQPATPTAPVVGTITHPTCEVGSGSVILSGLPSTGNWTITRTPGGTTTLGTGSVTIVTGIPSGTYTFTVTNVSSCISPSSSNVVINANPSTSAPPVVGTIIQPTCTVATGGVTLTGLPAAGIWTLTRTPGGTSTTGTGTSTAITGLAPGTYTFTVTPASGCISAASGNIIINPQPLTPTAPAVGTITQPTCTVPTGGVVLNGLPATGTWTLTRTPGGTSAGTGSSTTISGLAAGTYSYTVTNASGCISASSASLIINVQPSTPTAPTVGTITHPTCALATGSVVLNGLPATGTWSVTRTPGGTTTLGTGISTTISGIPAGIYSFTVTNASGCTSIASGNAVINAQPLTPTAPAIGTITQPTLSVPTGSVVLNGLPASGAWTLIRTPGNITTTGSGSSTTISGLAPGTYIFNVTNASGCMSQASSPVGLFILKLFGPDQKILRSNDTIVIENSDAGSISISVESNTDWTVSENSLWLKAVKESSTSKIIVTYLENISVVNKVAPVIITYTANPEMVINIQQKARVSQLNVSKFENVNIFPNPANDDVYLNFNEEEFEKILVSISNIQGYIISTEEFNNLIPYQRIKLDVSGIPVGKYFIIISDGVSHKTFHLIKF